jgi:hypothetical protein
LDLVYEERMAAVVNAAACLEAFVNAFIQEKLSRWTDFEALSVLGKWRLCLLHIGKDELFDLGSQPYQTLSQIFKLRNNWLHYKKSFVKVKTLSGVTSTWIETEMGKGFVEKLPNRVRDLMTSLCEATNDTIPEWLEAGPGWDV